MKMITLSIVALFATAAFANEPAKMAPAATTTPAAMTAPAATTTAAATTEHKDCTKMTDKKEKAACEAEMKKAAHKK